MRPWKWKSRLLAVLLSATPVWSLAALPQRDLRIELRQVEDRDTAGYSVGTGSTESRLLTQTLMVRNGEKASTRFNVSVPMQWAQKTEFQTTPAPVAGASSANSGAGVTQALQWFDAGQSWTVTPRWNGGKSPVMVEIEVQSAALVEHAGPTLPGQARSQLATTVSAPLGEWITLARSGGGAERQHSYSSNGAGAVAHVIQMRASLP